MKKHLVVFLLIISTFCYADGPNLYSVLAESGLNLRKGPSLESEILAHLKYGSIIYSYGIPNFTKENNHKAPDTIDGVVGHWIDAAYGEINGYIFSPYVYRYIKVDSLVSVNTIKVTFEGFCQGEVDYHPDLMYYGLFKDSLGFYLKKVDVSMCLSKVEGMEKFLNFECREEENILLETDISQKSLLLIGAGKEWEEGRLDHLVFNSNLGYNRDDGFIYPEQRVELNFNRHKYTIHAFDSIKTDLSCNIKKNYQLEFINESFESGKKITVITNLSKSLNLYGSGEKHSKYKTPKIYWAGDINRDGLLDLIIYQHSMVNHGGVAWTYSLFLTETTDQGFTFNKKDAAIIGSCH